MKCKFHVLLLCVCQNIIVTTELGLNNILWHIENDDKVQAGMDTFALLRCVTGGLAHILNF